MIGTWLISIGSDPLIVGIASLSSIVGLVITVAISVKTHSISKTLKKMNTAADYNDSRESFQRAFEGHRRSIIEDNDHSQRLVSNINTQLQQYKYQFREVFTLYDRWVIFRFSRILKKDLNRLNFNQVCSYLSEVSGRLSKKEDT